ncbi:DegT/DnrJ/EryC1/StrS family aminotransferase [Candidatus Pelagibacter sp.]|nr:DegT/DnrJ/EryC1/StrS family aminotransferase [Candidatus Pelagibacter sp.]
MKIPYYRIGNEFNRIKINYIRRIKEIFSKGEFINSNSNLEFENKISKLLNVKYCCGVANGSDALEVGMLALGIKKGDEVITASNSWVSSLTSIINIGAIPVLVDVEDDFNINCKMLKKAINKKTKAIMPVHLNGLPANMPEIMKISKKYKIKIIEDSAQAIMSKIGDKFAGTIGDVGCFSMHPTKNLGVAGDGGFIVTNSKITFDKIKLISNHGMNKAGQSIIPGRNSRLDSIQAELILHKIKHLKKDIQKMRKIAKLYSKELANYVRVPMFQNNYNIFHTFHRYVIILKSKKERNALKKYLSANNIETKVHYPVPLHKYKCFSKYSYQKRLIKSETQSDMILSLPCNQFINDLEVNYIIKKIKGFLKN